MIGLLLQQIAVYKDIMRIQLPLLDDGPVKYLYRCDLRGENCLESEKVGLGHIVHSRAGRDADRYFIIVGILNREYVLIADGDLRKVEKPKKKKIKHLVVHNIIASDIKNKIEIGVMPSNSDIRNYLKLKGLTGQSNNKEV